MTYRSKLPANYVAQCKKTGHQPITADYAIWLITKKGLRPAVVPGIFTTDHLDKLPDDERKRWLQTSRRRWLQSQRRKRRVAE